MDVADYERLLRVNTLGSMYTTRALLPRMKANRRGRILFTSSIAGQIGLYGFTAYSASKFAIVGLAQALQMEVKCYGIAVSVSYPPDTDTPGFEVENTGKPEVTRLISEGGGIFSPQQVGQQLSEGYPPPLGCTKGEQTCCGPTSLPQAFGAAFLGLCGMQKDPAAF
ncbi:unnamed protein product [Discosporangium mesarthrocarpum]